MNNYNYYINFTKSNMVRKISINFEPRLHNIEIIKLTKCAYFIELIFWTYILEKVHFMDNYLNIFLEIWTCILEKVHFMDNYPNIFLEIWTCILDLVQNICSC